jgi:hypothetical protein
VAKWIASIVPIGMGIGSLARLSTGGRSSTRSIASSHSLTTRIRFTASSVVSDPWIRSRSIVRALSTARWKQAPLSATMSWVAEMRTHVPAR